MEEESSHEGVSTISNPSNDVSIRPNPPMVLIPSTPPPSYEETPNQENIHPIYGYPGPPPPINSKNNYARHLTYNYGNLK